MMLNCRFSKSFGALFVVSVFLTLCLAPESRGQTTNGVLREVYLNIGGGAVSDLTNHPSFPDSPSLETIEPIFEAPSGFAENYGQRMRALVVAPLSGNYTFWIATDDGGALFLSTNEDPAQKVQIAAVGSWTASREWTKEPGQQSVTNIALVAGQRYYLEALQKEGGGGDNLAVRWRLPNNVIEEPIPNNRLLVFGLGPPVITQQPTNVTVVEVGSATFSVRLQHVAGATYSWKRNGTTVPNATNSSYTISPVSLGDSNSFFFCSITNAYGGTNSTTATLWVTPDITRPTISTAGNVGDRKSAFLVFSEPVETTTATNAGNYSISGGASVIRAEFGVDSRTIILTTTTLLPNITYVITVNNVRDRATTPNTILPNSQVSFSVTTGQPVAMELLDLSKEPLGPSSRRHGVVISEVMYHPTNRIDGRKLEFIEIYNSQAWFEEIGGWRISGAVDYTFPPGATIPARSFVVVAANPADLQAAYGVSGILGPYANSNSLPNDSGLLRLRNSRDAIVFEMNYTGEPPYPAAPDGGGHSLVLARPSYGERDPRAWAASDVTGGSPLAHESSSPNPYRTILINEFLAHTDLPQVDYIELFNYGSTSVNLSGCFLTDDPATNKFSIPANTTIPAGGFVVFTDSQLGFALSASGETILLRSPSGNRIIDSVRFGAQENGVSTGRHPDGASTFTRLASVTPGTNNSPVKLTDLIINEILFDPITGDGDDEYVELFNRGTNAVNLTGWRLQNAVSYNIPTNTIVAAGRYLVLAKNAARLRTNYSVLNLTNCLGNYGGSLGNGGEHIELTKPDDLVSTNSQGQLKTNIIHIRVDEVHYGPGGRWGKWAGGGGSSLELRDARSDNRLAPNWADSDESSRSAWVNVETTGVMDNGWAEANQLHVTLIGAGEALVDNIEVIPNGGVNLIANGTFESGTTGWVFQGNHNQSSWKSGEGFGSGGSLHLRAAGRGDSGSNRTRTQLPSTLAGGTIVTLRAKVRWLKGNPNILLRLRGNWLEAPGYILTARNLGTPGAVNSRTWPNAGPAITDVRHDPPLPAANQPVLISARVNDPDGLAFLAVKYRIDPGSSYVTVAMTNNGAGIYSTILPGQSSGATAAFFVQAADGFSPPQA
ncbi:MAG: lamin tail domain-containing protein, partial [Opitutaceae bacterium]|nr:lamin tail domain-containing protein [Verrucomicrobiales bacterium]